MFNVSNKDTRMVSGIFIVDFEHISHLVLVFPLLTLNMQLSAGLTVSDCHILKLNLF